MLIEFRVENFRSVCDEQALTFEAASLGDSDDPRPRTVGGHGARLLPATVLYGANASGKSNILAAIGFMRTAVLDSHRLWNPVGDVPRTAFAWGGQHKKPSTFEATFLLGETKYQYGFVVDDKAVAEEWLSAWLTNREQVWFERQRDSFKFGDHLPGPNDAIKKVTRANALFLSTAAQHGHASLMSLYSWFRGIVPINVRGQINPAMPELLAWSHVEALASYAECAGTSVLGEAVAKRVRDLLRAADVGIFDMKQVEVEHSFPGGHKIKQQRLALQNQLNDEDSWLDAGEASDGTKTLLRMAPSVFRVLDAGGLLIVDELESSLHPLLGVAIIKLFNSPKTNPKNAQILFTTHDTNLLGNTVGEPLLRRDQIWFTEKDKSGATKLYPLTDYKPRNSENLERGYLQGRYGAVPYLGNLDWMK